jgi:methylated-DNA-[protein]-cysteine S-methyltransferase
MWMGFFYDMPIGRTFIGEDGIGINYVSLVNEKDDVNYLRTYSIQETKLIQKTAMQLSEYFDHKRKEFSIRLNPKGTIFQKKVWDALLEIPYGETRSYKDIAKAVGNDKAARAVGMANHNNPIMFVIPCHRVIGANGSLTGYAGGIGIKEKLLQLEKTWERK